MIVKALFIFSTVSTPVSTRRYAITFTVRLNQCWSDAGLHRQLCVSKMTFEHAENINSYHFAVNTVLLRLSVLLWGYPPSLPGGIAPLKMIEL